MNVLVSLGTLFFTGLFVKCIGVYRALPSGTSNNDVEDLCVSIFVLGAICIGAWIFTFFAVKDWIHGKGYSTSGAWGYWTHTQLK